MKPLEPTELQLNMHPAPSTLPRTTSLPREMTAVSPAQDQARQPMQTQQPL